MATDVYLITLSINLARLVGTYRYRWRGWAFAPYRLFPIGGQHDFSELSEKSMSDTFRHGILPKSAR